VPVPSKDATCVDPNGVDCNTGPGELKGLVNGAGLVCMLDGGKTEGSGTAG
jgi:hypothetical protein